MTKIKANLCNCCPHRTGINMFDIGNVGLKFGSFCMAVSISDIRADAPVKTWGRKWTEWIDTRHPRYPFLSHDILIP